MPRRNVLLIKSYSPDTLVRDRGPSWPSCICIGQVDTIHLGCFVKTAYVRADNSFFVLFFFEVVGWCEGVMYLTSLGRPTDIGLQLGKACYPCSR